MKLLVQIPQKAGLVHFAVASHVILASFASVVLKIRPILHFTGVIIRDARFAKEMSVFGMIGQYRPAKVRITVIFRSPANQWSTANSQ